MRTILDRGELSINPLAVAIGKFYSVLYQFRSTIIVEVMDV